MPVIKIHLEHEELAAVERRAKELGITVQDMAYGALSCSMSHVREPFCRVRIDESVSQKGQDLPLWSDSAPIVGAYEGKSGAGSTPGPKGQPL